MDWDPTTLEALKNLESKLSSDLEAVRRVLALTEHGQTSLNEALSALMTHDGVPAVSPKAPSQVNPISQAPLLKAAALTRQAVTDLSGSFGIGDVKARIKMHSQRTFGDVAVRHQLKKMEHEGELVVTFQGLGRAGSQYAKTSRFQPSPLF